MLSKLSENQCLEISKWCLNYILNHGIHEKGLFRLSTASMNDIRRFKQQLSEGRSRRQLSDYDLHVVVGVLLSCFREMPVPLFHEMKDDLAEIDINDDSDENIHGIARSIAKLPAAKIEIVKILFEMLYQLATTPDNDANIAQLIMSIAPTIYKPVDTCYMSIRHTELLKLIRPVFQFITEHHAEIMRFVGPSKYQSSGQSAEALPSNITERLQQLQKISSTGGSAPNVPPPSNIPSIPSPASTFPPTKPLPMAVHLQLHIHSTMDVEGAENPYPEDLLNLSTHIAAHPPNFHSQEWKVLELLVNSRLDLWLKQGYTGASNLWDTEVSVGQSRSQGSARRNTDDLRLYDSDEDEKDPRHKNGSSSQRRRGESRRSEERRMLVAECKALRQEIQNYEERMKHDSKRAPSDKGEMQATYARYKELKRVIRDKASEDIQRLYRGYRTRSRTEIMKFRTQTASKPTSFESKKTSNLSYSPNSFKVSVSIPSPLSAGSSADQKNTWFGQHHSSDATSDSTQLVLNQLQTRYRECLEQKKQLKRSLKKFDDDFLAKAGRMPKKADKEVMRPQYQKYHEVRAELERLKTEITSLLGHFPAELEENRVTGSSSTATGSAWVEINSSAHSVQSNDNGTADSISEDDFSHGAATGDGLLMSSDDNTPLRTNANRGGAPVTAPPKGLDSLVSEKKQLHSYLKAFEKEFNRVNGRHVMHPEDIKPVAEEYQRYKELKKVLKDLRSTL